MSQSGLVFGLYVCLLSMAIHMEAACAAGDCNREGWHLQVELSCFHKSAAAGSHGSPTGIGFRAAVSWQASL